jgi:hypothetical protein
MKIMILLGLLLGIRSFAMGVRCDSECLVFGPYGGSWALGEVSNEGDVLMADLYRMVENQCRNLGKRRGYGPFAGVLDLDMKHACRQDATIPDGTPPFYE